MIFVQIETAYPSRREAALAYDGVRRLEGCYGAVVWEDPVTHEGKLWSYYPHPEHEHLIAQDGAAIVRMTDAVRHAIQHTRYARRDRYREGGGCRYCGQARSGEDCPVAVCKACHTPQCFYNGGISGQCGICYLGLLPGWSGHDRPCRKRGCDARAVAVTGRGAVCEAHAATAVHQARRGPVPAVTVAAYVATRLVARAQTHELIYLGLRGEETAS